MTSLTRLGEMMIQESIPEVLANANSSETRDGFISPRGFAMVALHNPKSGENVGGALRAAAVYGAAGVIVDGPRRNVLIQHPTNTMKAHLHMPVTWLDDLFDAIPHGAVPVAVELLPNAESLLEFKHPERAVYIFGAEDATLGIATTSRCAHSVYIPTKRCMNLAATVNVVLYDRLAKRSRGNVKPRVEVEGVARDKTSKDFS